MYPRIDKARKHVGMWAEDANRLKALSDRLERSQVELIHEAILALERTVNEGEESSRE